MRSPRTAGVGVISAGACALPAIASLTVYSGLVNPNALNEWQAAAGPTTFIGFTEFEPGTVITDQYAHLGIVFGAGDPDFMSITPGILNALTVGDFRLSEPVHAFALEMPSSTQLKFYLGDVLVAEPLGLFGSGFVGFTSTVAFDRVVLWDYLDPPPALNWIFIDNIYFQTIPAPGALLLLGAAALRVGRRRRAV